MFESTKRRTFQLRCRVQAMSPLPRSTCYGPVYPVVASRQLPHAADTMRLLSRSALKYLQGDAVESVGRPIPRILVLLLLLAVLVLPLRVPLPLLLLLLTC